MFCTRLLSSFLPHSVLMAGVLFGGLLLSPDMFAAKKSAPVTTPTSPEMEQRLANIERLLQNNGLLDMLQQTELLQQEVAKLRGEIEVNNHVLEQMKNRQRDLYTDTDRRLQTIENRSVENQSTTMTTTRSIGNNPPLETLGQTETVTAPEPQADAVALTLEQTESPIELQADIQKSESQVDQNIGTETPPVATITEDISTTPAATDSVQIQAEYQQAFKLLKESQYDQAIKAFSKFVKSYPDNQYSDNAQYWIAEALYVRRQYENAIREYNNLVSNYPDSQKVPHGLLKIGYSYQELGNTDTAKLWYTDLRQRFPGTTASRLAEDRLKNINDS